jgi:hypothetical protein
MWKGLTADSILPYALLGMTAVTGLVDAISFLSLGHAFTANMTGNIVLHSDFSREAGNRSPTWFCVESITSMVRKEICLPAGMVTSAGVFMHACSAGCGSLGSELVNSFGWSLAALSESNMSERMSARLYFCTEEPT